MPQMHRYLILIIEHPQKNQTLLNLYRFLVLHQGNLHLAGIQTSSSLPLTNH